MKTQTWSIRQPSGGGVYGSTEKYGVYAAHEMLHIRRCELRNGLR